MLTNTTVQFLKDLALHNDREWFHAHKEEYQKAYREVERFVQALIDNIAKFDTSVEYLNAKDCIFRIYRDTRFSRDKTPYKTNFGAHINAKTKRSHIHSAAGYYVHIELGGNSFLGGGAYMPDAKWLESIRKKIAENPKKFLAIIESPKFTKYFTFEGEKLKRPPQGYDASHPAIEILKHKSFLAMHSIPDKALTLKEFLQHCSDAFAVLKEFDDFLNSCYK